MVKKIVVSDHTYRILMNVYRRYRNYYRSLDEFLIDLIDTFLISDPEYMEELIEWLARDLRKKNVNVSIVRID